LTLVLKTNFKDYDIFAIAMDSIKTAYLHYYVFMMSVIRFTISEKDPQETLDVVRDELNRLQSHQALFFKDFDKDRIKAKPRKESDTTFGSSTSTDIAAVLNKPDLLLKELTDFKHLNHHYYLILAFQGFRLRQSIPTLLRMFINYSTLVPPSKVKEDKRYARDINQIRMKK
jgi:hypothetical protein